MDGGVDGRMRGRMEETSLEEGTSLFRHGRHGTILAMLGSPDGVDAVRRYAGRQGCGIS